MSAGAEIVRSLIREASDEAERWGGGSSYDEAVRRVEELRVVLAELEAK